MEAWQVFDASNSELLAQLEVLSNSTSSIDGLRLAGLIHQELAERGHLNQFLSKMGVCGVDETSRSGATVSPSTVTYQVPNPHGGSEDLLTGFAPGGVGTQLAQDPAPQSSTATAIGAICTATNATALEVQLSQRVVASIDGDGAPTCTATPAPSVLDAAVAAYKQEKQRLWKAKRAGAQAGWGFTKPHPAWPKPDKTAAAALGPVRSVSKCSLHSQFHPVAEGGTSLLRNASCNASCKTQSARPSALQPVQKVQQTQRPEITTSSRLSQPLSGSSPSTVHQVSLPNCAVGLDAQQPMHAEANSCRTRGLCPTERLCTPAVTGSGDLAPLQLVQHLESGCSQEQRSGSVPDAECGLTAAAEAWQTNVCGPQAEPLSDVPASTLQHKGIAQLKQNSGLLSPRMGADAQLQLATGDAAALRLQSTSHLNVEGVTQQHTDECSDVYASENPEQHQFMSAAQCLSSSEPQQPSAELNVVAAAAAAESDDQAVWPAAVLGDVPTSLRDDKSSSGDLASDACSECSEANMATASETWEPLQEATLAAVAAHHHQPPTLCRLNDWNMPGNEGLCSWPTTPVHDPFDRVAASLHESQGHTLAWNPRSAGTLRSMAKDGQADRLVITSVGGEHLILA